MSERSVSPCCALTVSFYNCATVSVPLFLHFAPRIILASPFLSAGLWTRGVKRYTIPAVERKRSNEPNAVRDRESRRKERMPPAYDGGVCCLCQVGVLSSCRCGFGVTACLPLYFRPVTEPALLTCSGWNLPLTPCQLSHPQGWAGSAGGWTDCMLIRFISTKRRKLRTTSWL